MVMQVGDILQLMPSIKCQKFTVIEAWSVIVFIRRWLKISLVLIFKTGKNSLSTDLHSLSWI